MFGLLKKKIGSFISSIVKAEEPEEAKQEIKQEELKPEPTPIEKSTAPESGPIREPVKPAETEARPKPTGEPKKPAELKHSEQSTEPEKPAEPIRTILEQKPEPPGEPVEIQKKEPTEEPKVLDKKPKQKEQIFEQKTEAPKQKTEQPKPVGGTRAQVPIEKKPAPRPEPAKTPASAVAPIPAPAQTQVPHPVPARVPLSTLAPVRTPAPTPASTQVPPPVPTRAPVPVPSSAPKPIEKTAELPRPRDEEERKLSVKLSLGTKIRSFISRDIEIKESDVAELLDGLNLALLESDVAYEVADFLISDLRAKLVGLKVPKGSVDASVKSAIREALLDILSLKGIDLAKALKEKQKPVKVLLLGPNGAGKTTTMAKLSVLLKNAGYSCVFSASDTFRAAAIEQAEKHGEKLGIRVIKHTYGADPTAVAFDAVNYARAHSIDVVLIDSAGRQETNRNLIDEMKKLNRVIQPDLKIFIGESIAGNALVSQVKSFSEAVGLDGVILTKLDCDAKGGTALSLSKATGVPILYFGVGQKYEDLVPFSAEYVVEQILGGP